MSKVTILRGLPGSGKSTLATRVVRADEHEDAMVVSTDLFFMDDGVYRFDPAKISTAHERCLRMFAETLHSPQGITELVVDNTNTTIMEIAPYAALALAYGWELEIITIECDPAVAAARNIHGVPVVVVEEMAGWLEENTKLMPPWWPHRVIQAEVSR